MLKSNASFSLPFDLQLCPTPDAWAMRLPAVQGEQLHAMALAAFLASLLLVAWLPGRPGDLLGVELPAGVPAG